MVVLNVKDDEKTCLDCPLIKFVATHWYSYELDELIFMMGPSNVCPGGMDTHWYVGMGRPSAEQITMVPGL